MEKLPDVHGDEHTKPDPETIPGTPRWVKVFGFIGLVLIVLLIILHLSGNSPFGGHGGHKSPSNVKEQGMNLP
jgi:hypothetical protein